jgi:hypothetical protein
MSTMQSRGSRLWDLWNPALGAVAAGAASWRLHAEARVFHDPATATAIFGGLLTFSALLASVLLALLAIIASLDARPIVQEMRRAHLYPQLVHAAFSPLRAFIALAVVSVSALLTTTTDRELIRRAIVSVAFAVTALGILSTVRFARLLVRVMIDPAGSEPPWDKRNTPEAARENRGSGEMPPRTGSIQHLPPS